MANDTVFRRARQLCGLSEQEAADALDVSASSIDKWSRGTGRPKPGVWVDLAKEWAAVKKDAARAKPKTTIGRALKALESGDEPEGDA